MFAHTVTYSWNITVVGVPLTIDISTNLNISIIDIIVYVWQVNNTSNIIFLSCLQAVEICN